MSLQPGKRNLTIWRGGTFELRFVLSDKDPETEVVTPRNLSGYTATLTIRSRLTEGDVLKTLTTANGGITLGEEGEIDIFISDEDTAAIEWNVGFYRLTVTDPSGNTDPLLFGGVSVKG